MCLARRHSIKMLFEGVEEQVPILLARNCTLLTRLMLQGYCFWFYIEDMFLH